MSARSDWRDRERTELDDLLAAVATGDQTAFSSLYDLVAAKVYGLILRVLMDRAQAEEVAQDVFFEVWQKSPLFDRSRGSGYGWIMTIAHHRAVDRVRAEQSSRDRVLRSAAVRIDPPYDQVIEAVEETMERDRVRTALSRLTDLQRESLLLAYFGGYTYREVSEILDAPLGTVKTRLRDGLGRLRAVLEGDQ